MKSFGKCLKMDLQSVGGEVSAAYMTLLLFTFFGANPLLVPSRIYMADYSFATTRGRDYFLLLLPDI